MEQTRAAPAAAPDDAGWRSPWLVPGGLIPLLALLTANVLAGGPLVAMDRRVRDVVHAQATAPGWRWLADGRLAPAQLLTDLGVTMVAVPVLAVCVVIAAARLRSLRPVAIAAAGLAVLAATVIPGKILIGRPGPGFASLPHGSWGDFPSGHASTAGVCYALAVLLLTTGPAASRARKAGLAAVAAVCFLVGVALVWCDYHWVTDVIAGWALAALIVWAVWRVQEHVAAAGTWRAHGGTKRRITPDD
jgi:membrane-associated phospholipid phosphatase